MMELNKPRPSYFEIRAEDVGLEESLPTLCTESAQAYACSKLWVKKGSVVKHVFTI
eukprot:CAMPEP_0184514742 /NCGR_PEP_ID=MMETSP0198_2-20121128/4126_1 /TAXON_ID=1112570 /ORGANISM="Thraustochytrium sp., Strain LLF1b" /LENGTH=55 /DNA_ID=CAMNT_0026904953 /DNA_START=341 /DNA_END=508 /DNA_ORIENTATION=-